MCVSVRQGFPIHVRILVHGCVRFHVDVHVCGDVCVWVYLCEIMRVCVCVCVCIWK